MSLPTRHGGLGLTSATVMAPHAFDAAREQAIKLKIDLPRTEYRKQFLALNIVPQGVRAETVYDHELTQATASSENPSPDS